MAKNAVIKRIFKVESSEFRTKARKKQNENKNSEVVKRNENVKLRDILEVLGINPLIYLHQCGKRTLAEKKKRLIKKRDFVNVKC